MIRQFVEDIVFRLALPAHTARPKGDLSHRPATFSAEMYDEWRNDSVRQHLEDYFCWDDVCGKRVLDFGCGTGPLTVLCAQHGAASVTGVDVCPKSIARARARAGKAGCPVTFIYEENTKRISITDNSVDVIVCFGVMEHVMHYRDIVREWIRVLAPGGRVLIWWSVWWHPYGHHLQTLIPLPWVHTFMSDESLMRVSARIYDHPAFKPRIWHFDENGKRKPNPYIGVIEFDDLNKLTIREFDTTVAAAGFQTARRQINPFNGRPAVLKRLLTRQPWPDFFCSCVVYELSKPAVPAG